MFHIFFTFSFISALILFSGCSGKSFTLQDYADKWFNEKEEVSSSEPKQEEKLSDHRSEEVKQVQTTETTKQSPANDIAWSSTAKRDKHNEGQGSMQKGLDKWLEEEWNPSFEGDEEQAQKDKNASKHFTIQHYIDKREKYLKAEDEKWKKSGKEKPEANYKKLDRLPVIGK